MAPIPIQAELKGSDGMTDNSPLKTEPMAVSWIIKALNKTWEPVLLHKLAIAAFIAVFFTGIAVADTPPNAEERATIETALKNAGFTSWEEIERDDDNRWEVDDAVHQDGGKYDLELDANSYAILKRERDD